MNAARVHMADVATQRPSSHHERLHVASLIRAAADRHLRAVESGDARAADAALADLDTLKNKAKGIRL